MAWVGTRQRPSNELASLISSRRGVRQCAETGASKGQEETLQSSRLAMDALARVHIFDLDNSGAPPAHSVDGVHAEPAVANEPRHDALGHTDATFSRLPAGSFAMDAG